MVGAAIMKIGRRHFNRPANLGESDLRQRSAESVTAFRTFWPSHISGFASRVRGTSTGSLLVAEQLQGGR